MRCPPTAVRTLASLGVLVLAASPLTAQQFNSDNYLSKPVGVSTIILTYGQHNDILMTTFSLLRNWEFTYAVYVFNSDNSPTTDDGYSTSLYFKWMLYENKAKTGGLAVKGGTGLDPGYISEVGLRDAFRTYWMNAPITLPFLDNRLSWDLMPGASYTSYSDTTAPTGWSFTYSTRLAWYPTSPTWSIVGEVYGGAGAASTDPTYKTGLRWEPNQYSVFALTYGAQFNGGSGSGWEIGMMLFTPPFFCISGCHPQ